jgi:hypothetical protein
LWDVTHNIGYVQIGISHDTGEFACDSVRYWWNTYPAFLTNLIENLIWRLKVGGFKK